MTGMLADAGVGIRAAISSRLHTEREIDPGEPANINVLLASECTQSEVQSVCANDVAS